MMHAIFQGCRNCGGDLFAGRMADGTRVLVCAPCGAQVPVTPVNQVWPFSAAVAPRSAA